MINKRRLKVTLDQHKSHIHELSSGSEKGSISGQQTGDCGALGEIMVICSMEENKLLLGGPKSYSQSHTTELRHGRGWDPGDLAQLRLLPLPPAPSPTNLQVFLEWLSVESGSWASGTHLGLNLPIPQA